MAKHITVSEVIDAALTKIAEGKLQLQLPNEVLINEDQCFYRNEDHPGVCCVIGSALTDEDVDTLDIHNTNSVIQLIDTRKKLTVDNPDEEHALVRLQDIHDFLCKRRTVELTTPKGRARIMETVLQRMKWNLNVGHPVMLDVPPTSKLLLPL